MPNIDTLVTRRYLVAASLAVSALVGCVQLEHPLSETGKVVVDSELAGEWTLDDPIWGRDESLGIRITMVGDGIYRFEDLEGNSDTWHEAKLVEAEGKTYLEIHRIGDADSAETESFLLPGFIQYERKGDWIALRAPAAHALRQHVATATEITGEYHGGFPFYSLTIDSSSDMLAKFLAKHGDEVFQGRQVYRRKPNP